MKRFLSLLLAVVLTLTCVIGLTGCSSAEDELLGTWEYTNSSGGNYSMYEFYSNITSTYTFTKSGDKYIAKYKSGMNSFEAEYKVEGNKIIFTVYDGLSTAINGEQTIEATYSLVGLFEKTLIIDKSEYTKK